MLMQTHGLAATQLLEDLLAVRERINNGWEHGGFGSGQTMCIMGHVNTVAGVSNVATFHRVSVEHNEKEARIGRMVLAIHESVYGPEGTPDNMTVLEASRRIANFNDSSVTRKDVVLLALDNAINAQMAPATPVREPAPRGQIPQPPADAPASKETVTA